MQSFALIADIHGNKQALEAILYDVEKQGIDNILTLGDYIGFGAYPCEVLDMVKPFQAVKGNHEDVIYRYHLNEYPLWKDSLQFTPIVWAYDQLNKDDINYIASLLHYQTTDTNSGGLYITHATPNDISKLVYQKDRHQFGSLLSDITQDVYVYGHTHEAWHGSIYNKLIINPGSAGISFLKKGLTQYTILTADNDGFKVNHRIINYDADGFIEGMKNRMLSECGAWAKAIIASIETGSVITLDFLHFAAEMARSENCDMTKPIPNDVWMTADDTYDWEAAKTIVR